MIRGDDTMKDTNPLDRYLVPLRRWWFVPVVVVVLGLSAAWITMPEPPAEPTPEELADPEVNFRATHILLRNSDSPAATNFDLVTLLARQGDLTNRVVERLDGEVTAADVDAVSLDTNTSIGTLSITAVQPTPDRASTLATTFAEELNVLLKERDETSREAGIEAATDRMAALQERIEELQAELDALPEEAELERRLLDEELSEQVRRFVQQQEERRRLTDLAISPADPFETLQEPSPVATTGPGTPTRIEVPEARGPRLLLAALVALVAGVGVVFLIDHLDARVRTRRDAENAFGLPVIAELPRRSSKQRATHPVPVRSEPDGVTAEAIRSLRVAVVRAPTWQLSGKVPTGSDAVGSVTAVAGHDAPRSLLVTSPLTGDGKTTLVANLAASFATSDQRVLVVDCDFRRPAIGELLKVGTGKGLRELTDPFEEPLKDLMVNTGIPGVQLVRAGRPGVAPPWFLEHSDRIIEQANDLADVVVFDTGPILLTNEALALIPSVESTLLIVRAGKPTFSQARDSLERLTRVGANVSGIALVGAKGGTRYGYYSSEDGRGVHRYGGMFRKASNQTGPA